MDILKMQDGKLAVADIGDFIILAHRLAFGKLCKNAVKMHGLPAGTVCNGSIHICNRLPANLTGKGIRLKSPDCLLVLCYIFFSDCVGKLAYILGLLLLPHMSPV